MQTEKVSCYLSVRGLEASSAGELVFPEGVENIILRTSPFKAKWQRHLFPMSWPVEVQRALWDEDASNSPISPTRSAAMKAIAPHEQMSSLSPENEKWTLNYAVDVIVADQDGRTILKPKEAVSILEIERMLHASLGGDCAHTFKVRTGAALYATRANMDGGLGLTHFEDHKFTVEPLTPAEIELYIHGIGGRFSERESPPSFLQSVRDSLVKNYDLDEADITQLDRGLTLEELKMTNMACRWPYINLQSKISSVNGIQRGEEGFELAMEKLFWALLGAPTSSSALIEGFTQYPLMDKGNNQTSLYPDLPGQWQQLMVVNGKAFSISRVAVADVVGISDMAAYNFRYAENYQYLTAEERELFIAANSPTGVWETSTHSQNLAALVVKELTPSEDRIVGWRVVRQSIHDPLLAEGRRMHIDGASQGFGLGRRLLAVTEDLARDKGLMALVVNSSGSSRNFFVRQGYEVIGPLINSDGVFSAGDQPKPDKVRLIKFL